MSKYNVGDVVKLRDDLEGNIRYGEIGYNKKMDRMKNKPIKLLRINHIYDNSYEVEDETGENWFLSDEMIEGLWEECKEKQDKLKLIDVLNMIANGELKEGTRVKYLKNIYIYKKYEGKEYASLYREEADSPEKDLFYDERYIFITVILNNEVELIEPDHFADVGKMEKIKELKYDDFWEWDAYSAGEDEEEFIGTETAIKMIFNKLNEVIRKINKE